MPTTSDILSAFPLVEQYLGARMGFDPSRLEPGWPVVFESQRRIERTKGYGYVRALWWLCLVDGRSAVSVPPGAGAAVRQIVGGEPADQAIHNPILAARLCKAIGDVLRRTGRRGVDRVFSDVCFACNAALVRRHRDGDCRRLTDASIPPAEGLALPTHCFPDGVAYGIVADGRVASVASGHRTGVLEDRVADPGVVTAERYRRRGYAKTAVSAFVEHFTASGGESWYVCRPDNLASIRTARSVGFVSLGKSLVLGAPAPDLSD